MKLFYNVPQPIYFFSFLPLLPVMLRPSKIVYHILKKMYRFLKVLQKSTVLVKSLYKSIISIDYRKQCRREEKKVQLINVNRKMKNIFS